MIVYKERTGKMKCRKTDAIKLAGKFMAGFLAATMVVTSAGVGTSAAKKPAISNKKLELVAGKTAVIKVKNSNKKAKITWKSSNQKVVKITKKDSKKKKATIKALKKGKAVISAKYKLGTYTKTLKCNVSVKDDVKPSQSPAPTAKPTVKPTVKPAVKPTANPTAVPTVAPTEVPFAWTTTWGTSEEQVENQEGVKDFIPLQGTTVRQIIRVTTSGDKFKLRLSNQYGKSAVQIDSMHLAKQGEKADKSDIDTTTDVAVTVDGEETFEIPAGEIIETDAIEFKVNALENIAVTTYFGDDVPTKGVTGHRGARATTYQVPGNEVSTAALEKVDGFKTCTGWFFIADASVWMQNGKAVVCFGDSITDGYGTDAGYLGKKPDSYTRWEDYFAKRLQANEATKNVAVINEGIGGNSIFGGLGPAGKDRFEREVTGHDNVEYCIILFGVNDMNALPENNNMWERMKPEYEKMIQICHDNDIKVYAAPILPFGSSSYYSVGSEKLRQTINNWFRSEESKVDGIIDFESAVADPDSDPVKIRDEYTTYNGSVDGLHPYDGYEAMADAIDLNMFVK